MEKNQENISLVTADGTPLKISLARAQRRSKIIAFLMVFPLLLFITIAFIGPIADMLMLSVDNSIVKKILPKSAEALQKWDEYSGQLPDEEVFAAIVEEIKQAKASKQHTKIGSRFNYESSGFSSLFRKTGRKVKKIKSPPFKDGLIKADKRWGEIYTWQVIKQNSSNYTDKFIILCTDKNGSQCPKPKKKMIYKNLHI